MSCRLTVRAGEAITQWDLDEWTALVMLASLSAEPVTIEELMEAMRRYQSEHKLSEAGRDIEDINEAAVADTMWCLVDLTGRTVIAGGGYELPDRNGAYEPSPGEEADGFPIVWLDTPMDFLCCAAEDGWETIVADRSVAAANTPPVDVRSVLFGRPLLDFLVDEVLLLANEGNATNENERQNQTRAIHAKWLMTLRDDLRGRTPRELLLADRERIQRDLEHRSFQWSQQGHAAHPIATDSHAYRFGGFGTIEVVVYFDLIRSLLNKAWKIAGKKKGAGTRSWLIDQLVKHRDRWMREPLEGEGMELPAEALIESERRRMPIAGNGSALDCDCPICRAEADGVFGSGPMFLWFDGHHLELEDEFAFSMTESFQEWEREQESYRSIADEVRVERENAELDAAPAPGEKQGPFGESVWKSTFVDWDQIASPDCSRQQSLFALAFPVAELVSDLKQRPQGRDHLRRLNSAYDDLRRASDYVATGSAARYLGETLEEVCQSYPELTSKCADLQSHLDEVLRRLV